MIWSLITLIIILILFLIGVLIGVTLKEARELKEKEKNDEIQHHK